MSQRALYDGRSVDLPLDRTRAERAAARERHPAGKGAAEPLARGRGAGQVVEVDPGDSLWRLAEERFGLGRAAECWPVVYRRNRDVIGEDPDHIEPGQKLTFPRRCS